MEKSNTVQKTVDVLMYLSSHYESHFKGVTLSAIAKNLNLPKATVHKILKTLMLNNFVQHDDSVKKNYCIGANAYINGCSYLTSSDLYNVSRPYLVLLAEKYDKTAFLSIRDKDRAVFIYKFALPNFKTHTAHVGFRIPLHSTSVGKCFLAFDPDASSYIDTIDLPGFTPYTITDRKKLKTHLDDLRKLGYSWEQRESHINMACVAAPLFKGKEMLGVISVTGLYNENDDLAPMGNEISQLAKLISAHLDKPKEHIHKLIQSVHI